MWADCSAEVEEKENGSAMRASFILEIVDVIAKERGIDGKDLGQRFLSDWRNLREEDPDLWEEIGSLPRLEQQSLIRHYVLLQEIGAETLLVLVGPPLIYWMLRGPVGHAIFASMHYLGKFFQSLGQRLNNLGFQWRFRYAIIMRNLEKCYLACGVDPENLRRQFTSFSYFAFTQFVEKIPAEAKERAFCLARCYVHFMIESIGMLSEAYFRCLKDAGMFERVKGIDRADILRMPDVVLSRVVCYDYQKILRSSIDEFFQFLDFLPPGLRTEMVDRLADEIYGKLEKEKNSNKKN